MAQIALGIGTSHGPQLSTPPEEWGQRASADRRNSELAFRGADYTFDELSKLRGAAFAAECELAVQRERHTRSRAAIDELGRSFLQALIDRDKEFLVSLKDDELRSGTSELRNWVTVGGALASGDLTAQVVDYVPCYRSEAGTGCAMAFMAWRP
jgi:hypothetical protein